MKDNTNPSRKPLLRLIVLFSLLLNIYGLYTLIYPAYEAGLLLSMRRWQAISSLGILGLVIEAALVAIVWYVNFNKLRRWAYQVTLWLARYKTWNLVAYFLLLGLCSLIIFIPIYDHYPPRFFTIISFYWHVALAGCVFLKAWSLRKTGDWRRIWLEYAGFSFLLCIAGYRIASFLQDISAYPFTLSWSETSSYYYASLFSARFISAEPVALVAMNPSRYLMLAVPFLLPDSTLWLHRAWQALLWIIMPLLTSWLLIRRVSPPCPKNEYSNHWPRALFFVIAYIFMLIGPVYYHLHVPLILILWGFKTEMGGFARRTWLKNLLVVVLASAWAGISRVNWYPVPGVLAALLILLKQSVPEQTSQPATIFSRLLNKKTFGYLLRPVAWIVIGLTAALAAQLSYIAISGSPPEHFFTYSHSALLWYRLLPNSTFPPGILPGILAISLPLVLFIWGRLGTQVDGSRIWKQYHPLRLLGIGAMLIVLFAGGLVVSVKIGGGSNLHNLDAYECFLLIVAIFILFDKFEPDSQAVHLPAMGSTEQIPIPRTFSTQSMGLRLALAIIIYALFSFMVGQPRGQLPLPAVIEDGLAVLNRRAEKINQRGREILFISNRHLITFNYIPNISLIPDYERTFLMEMAMASYTDYLEKFRQDLNEHRFALIINEPLYGQVRETDDNVVFREENNAWVEQVAAYIRCYYQEDLLLKDLQIQLFVPDPTPNKAQCPTEP